MTRFNTWEEAARPREPKSCAPTFLSVVPRAPPPESAPSAAAWRTTQQEAFGVGDAPDAVAADRASFRRPDAPWVKGRSGPRAELGRATSGCLGEVYKTGPNLQLNTAVQRSWLYYKDPMMCYKDGEAVPLTRPDQVTSLPGLGSDSRPPFNPHANNRRVAKLTRYADPKMHPLPGSRVFADQDEAVLTA